MKMNQMYIRAKLTSNENQRSPLSSLSTSKCNSFASSSRNIALTSTRSPSKSEGNANNHQKLRQELIMLYSECHCCKIKFEGFLEGMEHMKIIHKLHKCPSCFNCFYTLAGNDFIDHMKKVHFLTRNGIVVDTRIECRFCGESHRSENMWKHISEEHLNSLFDALKTHGSPPKSRVISTPKSSSTLMKKSGNSPNASLKSEMAAKGPHHNMVIGKGTQYFTDEQRAVMIPVFLNDPNQPWKSRATKLAAVLKIESTRISTWFSSERLSFRKGKFPKWAKIDGIPQYEVSYLLNGAMQIKPKTTCGDGKCRENRNNNSTTPLTSNESKGRQKYRYSSVPMERNNFTPSLKGYENPERSSNAKNEVHERIKILEADLQLCKNTLFKNVLQNETSSIDGNLVSDLKNQSSLVIYSNQGKPIEKPRGQASENKFSGESANERRIVVNKAEDRQNTPSNIFHPISNSTPTSQQKNFLIYNSSQRRDNNRKDLSTSRILFKDRESRRPDTQRSTRFYSHVQRKSIHPYPQRNYSHRQEFGYGNENQHAYRYRPSNYEKRSWNTKLESPNMPKMDRKCNRNQSEEILGSIQDHTSNVSQFHFSCSSTGSIDAQDRTNRQGNICAKSKNWKERHAEIATVSLRDLKIQFKEARYYMDALQKYFKSHKRSKQHKVIEQTNLLRHLVEKQSAFEEDQRQCIDQCLNEEKCYGHEYVMNKNFKMDIARYWVPILVYVINFDIAVEEAVQDFIEASKWKSPIMEFPDIETIKNIFKSR